MSKISIKNITEVIEETTRGKSGAELEFVLKNIVKFLYTKKLLSQSPQILEKLEEEINKKENRIQMKIRSANKISENKKKEIEKEMKNKYKAKEIVSEYFEDKSLLGGMKIEIGEDTIDGTYRNRLNQLEKHLISK